MAKVFCVKGVTYTLPKIGKKEYFKYLDVFDRLQSKDATNALYNYQDYKDMADALALVYGNKFTGDDIIDDDNIEVEDIMTEFMYVEMQKTARVENNLNKYRKAFQNGKNPKKR